MTVLHNYGLVDSDEANNFYTGEGNPVTICVAAIAQESNIIAASDRMLTSRDIEFNPVQAKIWKLSNSIVLMTAGDIAVHGEMLQGVIKYVGEKIVANREKWVSIKDAAEKYGQLYSELRAREMELRVLGPFGLTKDSFISRQKEMSPDFVRGISQRIEEYSFPAIEAIIAGLDETGPHLYVVSNSTVICNDTIGFASIGIGKWHSNSQFMASGHSRYSSESRTLLITHRAKKKAEVAPGVGSHTDMIWIGPKPGSLFAIPEDGVSELDELYADYFKEIAGADATAEKGLEKKLAQRIERANAQKQAEAANPKAVGP